MNSIYSKQQPLIYKGENQIDKTEKYMDDPKNKTHWNRVMDDEADPTPVERSVGVWETKMFTDCPAEIDLLKNLARLSRLPIKVVQGKGDNLCHADVAEHIAASLKSQGAEVSFSLIENEGHSPYTPKMMDALVRATDTFAASRTFTE